MKWNWEVFLKSWLFGFLGFLIGIVSTIIYLAIDVDLSKLDGTLISTIILAFATVTLVIVSYKYAKSTEEMLEEQRKSRKIAEIERKIALTENELRDLYYPLDNFLKRYFSYRNQEIPERYLQVSGDLHNTGARNKLMEYKDIIKHKYLAKEDIQDKLNEFLNEKNISRQTINDTDVLTLYDTLASDVKGKINSLNKKLTDLMKELFDLYNSQD